MSFLFAFTAFAALIATPGAIMLYLSRERLRDELAAAHQKMAIAEQSEQEIRRLREQFLESARAAMFETSGAVSSQLLEQHRRETLEARKDAEAALAKITNPLLEQVGKIVQNVSILNDRSGKTQERTETLWRALTSPAGAGQFAEMGLENTLKNLGLEAGRDFIMQYAIAGSKQRPDAIIFLPQNRVMVIDCKASRFLMDIASAKDAGSETEALLRLRDTMQKHLKDLISRDYREGVLESYRAAGRQGDITTIFTVMHLPTESAIEQLRRADPEFVLRSQKAGIIVVSPANLFAPLSLAQHDIGLARQAEGQMAIAENLRDLMDNVILVLGYAEKMGRGIKTAAESFDDFARSVNRRLLPKMRQLMALGVSPNKKNDLPARMISYELRASEVTPALEDASC